MKYAGERLIKFQNEKNCPFTARQSFRGEASARHLVTNARPVIVFPKREPLFHG